MLHFVHHLHGRIQITTTQTVVDHSPHRVAFYLTILDTEHTQKIPSSVAKKRITKASIRSHSIFLHFEHLKVCVCVCYLHARQRPWQLNVEEAANKLVCSWHPSQLGLMEVPKYSNHGVVFIAGRVETHKQVKAQWLLLLLISWYFYYI